MRSFIEHIESRILPILCFAAAANALLPAIWMSTHNADVMTNLINGFGHSYVIWLCLLLSLKLAIAQPITRITISPMLWLALLILSLLLLIPSAMLSWLICIELCLIWQFRKKPGPQEKLANIILIAVASRDPLCQSILHLFAEQILSFDAWISGLILLLINNPVTISGNTISQADGHGLLILTGCSAFTNLSLALLLWFSFSLYYHQKLLRQDYARAVLLVALILAINSSRLALMAINQYWYHWLHDGYSQELIEFLTIVIALLCIRRSPSHEIPSNNQHGSGVTGHSAS